jgi:tRNA (cmo5U34)-methyltransferase
VEGGCGSGLTTVNILNADQRIRVLGIDKREAILNQARLYLSKHAPRVDLRKQDLLDSLKNMQQQYADAFASAWTIHNLTPQYRQELFPEISRILKVGGLFVNGDCYAKDEERDYQEDLEKRLKEFDKFDEIGRSDLKHIWVEHCLSDKETKIREGEQIIILENLGFESIKICYRKGMEAIITGIKK